MVSSVEFRSSNVAIRSRLLGSPGDPASVESCRRELAALAPKIIGAIELELLRLMSASEVDAA
jgi:hypothetical protein